MSIAAAIEPYLIPAVISGAGVLIWSGIQQFRIAVENRIDALEDKMDHAIKDITAVVVRQGIDQAEIAKLRDTTHRLMSDVTAIDAVQERCRTCNPRS